MSENDASMSGIKGKRIPGKPGRFDPSEPLHMTTRRKAKTGPSNGSPSVNGSVDDDESRRNSLDDSRPITSHSNESQYSIKSRRLSEASLPAADSETNVNGSVHHEKQTVDEPSLEPFSPAQQTPASPSRKRKRSSSPSAPEKVHLPQPLENDIVDATSAQDITMTEAEPEVDTVELVPPEDLSDRAGSQQSFRSDEDEDDDLQADTFQNGSMDITPAVSNPPSPGSGESGPRQKLFLEDDLEDDIPDDGEENVENGEDIDVEADVDGEAADDAEGGDDVDEPEEQLRSEDDGRPASVRRFGGRRRAQHPIPKVEKAMQRQAELKSAYRTIARIQKAVLAEVAQRTIDDLEADQQLYARTVEYPGVKGGLDEALVARQHRLQMQLELNMQQLRVMLEAQQQTVKERCTLRLQDLKEFRLACLEHEMMRIVRQAQTDSLDDGYLTDTEDGMRSKTKTKDFAVKEATSGVDAYDSRSRLVMETMRVTEDLERRFEMQKLLDKLDDEDKVDRLKQFTLMDERPRKAAAARSEGLANGKVLAEAAAEHERRSNIPIIPNKDCAGLQLLGDLATRPSITAPARDPLLTKPRRQSMSYHNPTRPLPPQLQIPKDHRPSPIPVEMSPRTTQAMGDRFETSMPPPVTPLQRVNLFAPSPEANAWGTMGRLNPIQDYPARTPDRWAERKPILPSYHHAQSDSQNQGERNQEAQFSPGAPNDRRPNFPLWREYARESPATHNRRPSDLGERPQFGIAAALGMRDERRNTIDPQLPDRPEITDSRRTEPSPRAPIRPPYWPDQPSQLGAMEARFPPHRSLNDPPRQPTLDPHSPVHSRMPSTGFTAKEYRPDMHGKSNNVLGQKDRGPKFSFPNKTNKDERDGMSRKHYSHVRKLSKSLGGLGPLESPTATSSATSPVERSLTSAPWRGPPPPQHSPQPVPPPPAAPYQQSPYSQPPPLPTYRPPQTAPDFQQHRNSFTSRPASSSHERLPPTPLYVVPQQQQQHPPPPGVPSEQYNRPFAPPPPPGYQPPPVPPPPPAPPPSQTPQTPYPQSAPGTSYSNQYGGPPLAPAGANTYHPLGVRPQPAFAQQAQQQQQTGFGNRRRTQSDASQLPKFQSWTPPTGRR